MRETGECDTFVFLSGIVMASIFNQMDFAETLIRQNLQKSENIKELDT